MLTFQKGMVYPLIKVMTPPNIDFITEHETIIKEKGYVWFCRFGKNNMKINSLKNCEKSLFIKESEKNGGNVYVAEYDIIKDGAESVENNYPSYYNNITQIKGLWIKLLSITEYSKEDLEANFVINTSGNNVSNILKSMCPATFLRYIK